MKLICPHCGLGGIAGFSLFGRKVRCPGCRKVFIINDDIALPFSHQSAQIIGINESDYSNREVGDESEKFAVCSICGYTLNRQFLRMFDSKQCCTICMPE